MKPYSNQPEPEFSSSSSSTSTTTSSSSVTSSSSSSSSSLSSPNTQRNKIIRSHVPTRPKPTGDEQDDDDDEQKKMGSQLQSTTIVLPQFLLPGPALLISTTQIYNSCYQTQLFHPPGNFASISPGLYRSSFPRKENISTLVQEEYPIELIEYYKQNGIKLIQIRIPGNKDKIRLALRLVLDIRNHPMLIHCNKGKHRTGCLVGCLRKLQHWSSTAIFDEYRRYAFPKSRNMDQQFIELFDHSPVWEEIDPEYAPEWFDLSL